MNFHDWLTLGIESGYCGPIVCNTHDGTPTTAAEDDSFDDGDEPCIPAIRIYNSPEEQTAVESNHKASVWRKPQVAL
jgi:hypothetical protein